MARKPRMRSWETSSIPSTACAATTTVKSLGTNGGTTTPTYPLPLPLRNTSSQWWSPLGKLPRTKMMRLPNKLLSTSILSARPASCNWQKVAIPSSSRRSSTTLITITPAVWPSTRSPTWSPSSEFLWRGSTFIPSSKLLIKTILVPLSTLSGRHMFLANESLDP